MSDRCARIFNEGKSQVAPLDQHTFEPSGYSCNAILGPLAYGTVHVSPEKATSYSSAEVSVLTSAGAAGPHAPFRLQDWCEVMRPKQAYFVDLKVSPAEVESSCPRRPRISGISGYKLKRKTQVSVGPMSFETLFFEFDDKALQSPPAIAKELTPIVPASSNRLPKSAAQIVETHRGKFLDQTLVKEAGSVAENLLRSVISDRRSPFTSSLALVDLGKVARQFKKWTHNLPSVKPYYAVKCNSDVILLDFLHRLGAGFDCASSSEMQDVLKLGVLPEDVVFSHPVKSERSLTDASKWDIRLTVFDNQSELKKIAQDMPQAELLLRIRTDDTDAQCPLSMKYGSPADSWSELLKAAVDLNLRVVGVHFHVGSGCRSEGAFSTALQSARAVFNLAEREHGIKMNLLDIGGGFPGESNCLLFEQMTKEIRSSLEKLFDDSVRVIAEPGRFFAAASLDLAVRVISKREPLGSPLASSTPPETTYSECPNPPTDDLDRKNTYYVNDGVYGSFNSLIYDHASVSCKVLCRNHATTPGDPLYLSTVFGQTCDGFDQIMKSVYLPDLNIGDWLIFGDMGAYTVAAASSFNGFTNEGAFYTFLA
eukprot:GHVO01056853.1.p1 GENE.GHVO01056853.1~~GHVO01056853.1.p1  ORF type:complete len:606 (+),score=72.07 GHVO01056853.1:35-1819(+)